VWLQSAGISQDWKAAISEPMTRPDIPLLATLDHIREMQPPAMNASLVGKGESMGFQPIGKNYSVAEEFDFKGTPAQFYAIAARDERIRLDQQSRIDFDLLHRAPVDSSAGVTRLFFWASQELAYAEALGALSGTASVRIYAIEGLTEKIIEWFRPTRLALEKQGLIDGPQLLPTGMLQTKEVESIKKLELHFRGSVEDFVAEVEHLRGFGDGRFRPTYGHWEGSAYRFSIGDSGWVRIAKHPDGGCLVTVAYEGDDAAGMWEALRGYLDSRRRLEPVPATDIPDGANVADAGQPEQTQATPAVSPSTVLVDAEWLRRVEQDNAKQAEETRKLNDLASATEEDANVISILFLAADPTDASRLRLGEELREIQEKLQLSKYREQFVLSQRMSIRPADLSQALLDIQPQIVHFSGHGTSTGALCIEDKLGQIHPIEPGAVAALFERFKRQVRCVVLNACFSDAQASAIGEHIDYVIGMNQEIGDEAAIAFAIGFYQGLGGGRSFEDAYELGRVQIRLHNIPEYLTPVLINKVQANPMTGSTPPGDSSAKKSLEVQVNVRVEALSESIIEIHSRLPLATIHERFTGWLTKTNYSISTLYPGADRLVPVRFNFEYCGDYSSAKNAWDIRASGGNLAANVILYELEDITRVRFEVRDRNNPFITEIIRKAANQFALELGGSAAE
jgi:CHAT domain